MAEFVLKYDIYLVQCDAAPFHPTQHAFQGAEISEFIRQLWIISPESSNGIRVLGHWRAQFYSVPLRACSRSIASNSALKLPLPKLREPWRSMTSKNSVGRSSTGLVKIWSR